MKLIRFREALVALASLLLNGCGIHDQAQAPAEPAVNGAAVATDDKNIVPYTEDSSWVPKLINAKTIRLIRVRFDDHDDVKITHAFVDNRRTPIDQAMTMIHERMNATSDKPPALVYFQERPGPKTAPD